MDTAPAVIVPRPAASVLLVRDRPAGIEVFMATRHGKSSFMPGVLVFPGGAVDPDDSHPALAPAQTMHDSVWRVAAIRETFEEAGFLLARPRGGEGVLGAEQLARLRDAYRTRLCRGEVAFSTMMAEEGLEPALDLMIPFGHWTTPNLRSKRFDTMFYLAPAPDGQVGAHDERELVDSRWVRPADALAERDAGKVQLVFATRANLGELGKSETVAAALDSARLRRIVSIEPELFDSPDGRKVRIPADAGYDLIEILARDSGL
jgi:8-oxo-dGTP pyrophosphatase MutT (NUDIX family)